MKDPQTAPVDDQLGIKAEYERVTGKKWEDQFMKPQTAKPTWRQLVLWPLEWQLAITGVGVGALLLIWVFA